MYKGKRREDPKAKGQPSKPAKRQVQSKKPQQSYDERREKDYDEDRYAAAQEDDEEEEEEEEGEREEEEQEGSDGRYSDKRSLSSEGSADEDESPDNENHEENDDYGVRKIHDYEEEDEEERNEEDEQDNTQDEMTRSTGNISSKTYPRSRNSKLASRASTNQNYDESRGNTQYEDDQENEADPKPGVMKATDRFEDLNNDAHQPRFIDTSDDLEEPETVRDGKRCLFFVNGNEKSKPTIITINKKYKSWNTLLTDLENSKKTPCHYIYSCKTGKRITNFDQFVHGETYVVSGPNLKRYVPLNYGSYKDAKMKFRPDSVKAGNIKRKDLALISNKPAPIQKPHVKYKKGEVKPPRVVTIINNTQRGTREKVVINPNTSQMFEEVLCEMGPMIDIDKDKVSAMYTCTPPFSRVKSFSHLFSEELRDCDSFIVCGSEGVPPELRHQNGMADEWMERDKKPKNNRKGVRQLKKERDSGHSSISTR